MATPMLILGTVRGSSVVKAHEVRACQDELLGRLEFFRMRVGPAWNIDRGHEWLEPSCICLPTSVTDTGWQVRTLDLARRMGINTAIRIKETVLEVLALEPPPSNRYSVVASTPASITRDVEHRCPMTRAPESGEYCPMRGGPWTSNAMRAAATWRDYRNLLVQAVGCDTCEGQREAERASKRPTDVPGVSFVAWMSRPGQIQHGRRNSTVLRTGVEWTSAKSAGRFA